MQQPHADMHQRDAPVGGLHSHNGALANEAGAAPPMTSDKHGGGIKGQQRHEQRGGFFHNAPSFAQWWRLYWSDIRESSSCFVHHGDGGGLRRSLYYKDLRLGYAVTMALMGALGLGLYESPPAPNRSFPITFVSGDIVMPENAYPLRKESAWPSFRECLLY